MATVVLRPNGTRVNYATIAGGAPSPHDALRDLNDATYLQASAPNSYVGEYDLDNPTLPAGAYVLSARATYKVAGTAPGAWIRAGLSNLAGSAFDAPIGLVLALINGPASTVTNTGQAITAADLTASYFQISSLAVGSAVLRVAEAYLTVTYAIRPTATATAPTGTITAGTNPAVAWTHAPGTDAPGGQDRYEVRIFDEDTYTAPGFSPDTAPPVWASGEVPSTATTTGPLPVSLPNLTNYRAYVRTHQPGGPYGAWSAWSYTAFAIDVAGAPGTPGITATADADTPRTRIAVTRGTGAAWHLIDVERSDDLGATWQPIRSGSRVPVTGFESAVLYDYEAPADVPVRYRARAIVVGPDLEAASPWAESSSATITVGEPWLLDPLVPARNRRVRLNEAAIPTLARPIARGVHRVLGRSAPIVTSDLRSTVEGAATFLLLDADELADLVDLLAPGTTLLLRTPASFGFGNRYLAIGDVEEARPNARAQSSTRLVTAAFVEVDPPAGDLAAFGWVWADVIEARPTWEDTLDGFASWADLIGGIA